MALSENGLAQAGALADGLASIPLAAVYSSPVDRARVTAAAIGARQALVPEVEDGLDEIDFGDWTGRSFASLDGNPLWNDWNAHRSRAAPPGGESMAQATGRALTALDRIAARHPDASVAAVTHCDIIRGVIAHHLGLGLDNLLRFDVDPASVSRLAIGGWGARVMSINEGLCR